LAKSVKGILEGVQETLINLPEKKGIITKTELLEEIKRLQERKIRVKAGGGVFPENVG